MTDKLGILSGGSGSSKFVSAFGEYGRFHGSRLVFVANVADNFWHHNLYVCPDLDITVYALAKGLNRSRNWGLESDSLSQLEQYGRISGEEEWFQLGDRDAALSILRTNLIRKGWSLSKITDRVVKQLGIDAEVVPCTDDSLQTYVSTFCGLLHLQEFWVKNKGAPRVRLVLYAGLENARANPAALKACSSNVIICPANPITSVLPIVKVPEIESKLKSAKVLAISPFLKGIPFSGPAGKLMAAQAIEADSYGVAKLYDSFLKIFVVHVEEDRETVRKIKDLGMEVLLINTRIQDERDKATFAKEISGVI